MTALKDKVIAGILAVEGGYVNDPNDSGGATNFGITEAVARENGYRGDMQAMSKDFACIVYQRKYWDALKLDEVEALAPNVAAEMADMAVNMGIGTAGSYLQRALNVLNNQGADYADIATDGAVGEGTITALKAYIGKRGANGQTVLYRILNCLHGAKYVLLCEANQKDEKFMFGWMLNRVS